MKKVLYSLIAMIALASCTTQPEKTVDGKNDYDVMEKVIMSRRSVRHYTDSLINRDTLNEILKCGINAPNGKNRQSYEIRVVDNPKLLSEITEAIVKDDPSSVPINGAKNVFVGATCVIFIANDTTYDMSQIDCGLLGMARSAGNCATELAAATLERAGYLKNVDLYKLLDYLDQKLIPAMEKYHYHVAVNPTDLMLGLVGCHSNFLGMFKKVAEEEGVSLLKLIAEVSAVNRKNPDEALLRKTAAGLK